MEELSGINNPGTAPEPSPVSPDPADDAGDAAYMALFAVGKKDQVQAPRLHFHKIRQA